MTEPASPSAEVLTSEWDVRTFYRALIETELEALSHEDGWTLMLTADYERLRTLSQRQSAEPTSEEVERVIGGLTAFLTTEWHTGGCSAMSGCPCDCRAPEMDATVEDAAALLRQRPTAERQAVIGGPYFKNGQESLTNWLETRSKTEWAERYGYTTLMLEYASWVRSLASAVDQPAKKEQPSERNAVIEATTLANAPYDHGKRIVGIVIDEGQFRYMHEAIDWLRSILIPGALKQPSETATKQDSAEKGK